MTTFLAYVDRSLSGVVDSKFTEIKFESNTLDHVQMFASDGTPLYWCRVARERPVGYRCYDRNGRDPYNQEELRPISPEILSNIRTGMLSARPTSGPAATDPVNSPSRPIRTPVVRAETAPQLTAKPATIDLISPLARRGATSTGVPRWTVVAWGADSRPDVRLLEDIQTVGASIGLSRPTQALRDSFVSNGASRQVLQGDLSVLREVELGQYTDYLILAEFSSHPQRETERGPLRSVTGELRVVLVRLSDMSTSKSIRVVEGGAGADFQDAGERAYLRLMQTAKPKLDSALRGFVQ